MRLRTPSTSDAPAHPFPRRACAPLPPTCLHTPSTTDVPAYVAVAQVLGAGADSGGGGGEGGSLDSSEVADARCFSWGVGAIG
eukprot:1466566-Prymnesium_polylepis.1